MYNWSMKNNSINIYLKLVKVFIGMALIISFLPIANVANVDAQETTQQTISEKEAEYENGAYDKNHVLVKFKDSVESASATSTLDSTDSVKDKQEAKVDAITNQWASVEVEDGSTVEDAIQELKEDSRVENAEPNYEMALFETGSNLATTSVNDPQVSQQWHINDSISNVKEAWDLAKCNDNATVNKNGKVTVAIVDSGIDKDHSDLVNNIIAGYSVVGSDTTDYDDRIGHGTNVGGIISAQSNNSLGGTGVSYNANILPIKVTNAYSGFGAASVAKAVNWAVDNSATYNIKVINLSLGMKSTETDSELLAEAVNRAWNSGILCVCASGNNGTTSGVSFPASMETTISVGAVAENHTRASYSNGGTDLDVVAPGSNIVTTLYNGQTANAGSGTSFAAPLVSATAALCYVMNNVSTPTNVKSAITSTAKDLGTAGKDIEYGYGQVVVNEAVKKMSNPDSKTSVYRMYNAYTGEHFFTMSASEKETLSGNTGSGWIYEGVAWNAYSTQTSGCSPVYRLCNSGSWLHFFTNNEAERASLKNSGWIDEGIAWYSPSYSDAPSYRLYNESSGQHFFTTNINECVSVLRDKNWKDEGIGFYGIATDEITSSTVPVYRLYNDYLDEHFYTTSLSERASLINARYSGWSFEGIAWWSRIDQTAGLTPIYRLYNNYNYFHMFTSNSTEVDILKNSGWSEEGIVWYSSTVTSKPVYRVYNAYSSDHFLTANESEKNGLLNNSQWVYEGIVFYAEK